MSPLEHARAIIAAAVHAEPAAIPGEGSVADIPGWDSIAHVNIMLAIEAATGRTIPASEAGRLFSVAAIARYLETVAPGSGVAA